MRFAMFVGLLMVWAAAGPTSAAQGDVVARFSGEGDTTTRSFKVSGAFEVRWQTERAAGFRIMLKGLKAGIPSIVADPAAWGGKGEGTTSYVRGGDYHFEVRASGPWQIEVVENSPF